MLPSATNFWIAMTAAVRVVFPALTANNTESQCFARSRASAIWSMGGLSMITVSKFWRAISIISGRRAE